MRWVEIPWRSPRGEPRFPGVPAGDRRFVVCVLEGGATVNLITHRYIIGNEGEILETVDGLTKKERREYERLSIELNPTAKDEARLAALQGKWSEKLKLPVDAARFLIRDLPAPPPSKTNCGIWSFFSEMGVHMGTSVVQ